jgi:transposase
METPESYVNERLDHLGLVAGVCEEIGLAAYRDRLAGETKHHVSMGTATVAMILNGLGFSNRRLYLVPQFFANKPVERLLGPGIEAADLNDDCLDRTLDWLYAQDPTQVCAGIATQARKIFGVSARQVHVDTTSFAVSGADAGDESAESEASVIAITYGYSRDHREDLKQWMLALATTHEGEVPLFLRPLMVKQAQVEQEARCKACFIVATNVVDESILSDQERVTTYQEQGSVERGFRALSRSIVPGLFRLRQKARAHRRARIDHGALLTGLPAGRTSVAYALSRNRADYS